MPTSVARMVTIIQWMFLWVGVSTDKRICKVAWHMVARETNRGGLGIGFLKGKNKSMIFKWLCRLGEHTDKGRQQLITNIYQPSFINGFPLFKALLSPKSTAIYSIINNDNAVSSLLK